MTSTDDVLGAIAKAAPFIDASWSDDTTWKPSEMLRIRYFVLGSSLHPDQAIPYVHHALTIARHRFVAGLDPNPFVREGSHDPS